MLEAIRASGGEALAVTDDAMLDGVTKIGGQEGIHACPEGGATFAALELLVGTGRIARGESVVLFNTGTGLKYPGALGSLSGR
jgi:threonine synthase